LEWKNVILNAKDARWWREAKWLYLDRWVVLSDLILQWMSGECECDRERLWIESRVVKVVIDSSKIIYFIICLCYARTHTHSQTKLDFSAIA
jgi:hypothetical protein